MNHPLLAIPIFLPIALICLAFGGLVIKSLGIKSSSLLEACVFGTAIGFGGLAYCILGIGLAHVLTPAVLIGLLVILAIATFTCIRALVQAIVYATRELGARKLRAPEALALLGASVLAGLALVAALAPPGPTDWDGLAYHLAVPKLYLAEHSIFHVPFTSHSNFPFLTEMLYTLGLALHGPALAKLFHYAMYLLAAAGIYALCRRHVTATAGAVGALLFMSVPLVIWEAGVAYADITTAMYILLAAHAVLNWEETRQRGWLSVAGIMSGFALGTKMLAIVPIAAICLWVLWAGGWKRGLKGALFLGLLAGAVGAPWYVKTYIYTGNPVYPFFYGIFGGRNFSQADADLYSAAQQAMGMGRSALDFIGIPWNVTMHGGRFYDTLILYGLLGPAFLGLIAVQILAGQASRAVLRLAFVSAVFVGAWFLLMQNARYVITVLPFLAIIAGSGASIGLREWRKGRIVAAGFIVICMGVGIFTGYALVLGSVRASLGLEPADEYLSRSFAAYDAFVYINESTPEDSSVLLFDEPRGFYLNREYIWADPGHHQLIPWHKFMGYGEMLLFFEIRGYTHAVINWSLMSGKEDYETLLFQAIGTGRFLEVFSANRVSVYEITAP